MVVEDNKGLSLPSNFVIKQTCLNSVEQIIQMCTGIDPSWFDIKFSFIVDDIDRKLDNENQYITLVYKSTIAERVKLTNKNYKWYSILELIERKDDFLLDYYKILEGIILLGG